MNDRQIHTEEPDLTGTDADRVRLLACADAAMVAARRHGLCREDVEAALEAYVVARGGRLQETSRG